MQRHVYRIWMLGDYCAFTWARTNWNTMPDGTVIYDGILLTSDRAADQLCYELGLLERYLVDLIKASEIRSKR